MNTNQTNSKDRIKESDIDWTELANIGINRDEINKKDLERLLCGESVDVSPLRLNLLGTELIMDANIRFINENNKVMLEVQGVEPVRY